MVHANPFIIEFGIELLVEKNLNQENDEKQNQEEQEKIGTSEDIGR